MRITRLRTWQVPPRWLFLKIETDAGCYGWGEPVIEGRAATVEAAVHELSDCLIGQDPHRIEHLWNRMYRGGFYRGGPILMSAIAGIDQALWDLKGRDLGVPVHQLLGGAVRDRMRMYAWTGGDRPSDVGAGARALVAQGFTAFKMNGTAELAIVDSHREVDEAVARLAEAREAVGPDVGIAIDFHGRVHRPMAKALLRELEPSTNVRRGAGGPRAPACLKEIAGGLGYPLATGERLYTRFQFRDLLADGMTDIVQPDLSHCGGISEGLKIATLASAHDVALAPHCPLGPLTLAASLQLDAVCHNAFIQEQSMGIHYNRDNDVLDYLVDKTALAIEEGFCAIPQGPGLGVEIDEAFVEERAKVGHRWRNPLWTHEDGSVAEW
ncbi:galactonate dehydratase [Halomonas sp. BC04]|uniref:galactonate dehydratase n=1 Tax=Halomonas sp. BC04 TaxID=1403540 RepID=UPI0003ED7FA8|nr:galactonate dehydratase [Halomonas sp. BC04]EWH00751.1 galactonate dehydratase [Halomonas sp. BC04]